jgi:hypothetical protein
MEGSAEKMKGSMFFISHVSAYRRGLALPESRTRSPSPGGDKLLIAIWMGRSFDGFLRSSQGIPTRTQDPSDGWIGKMLPLLVQRFFQMRDNPGRPRKKAHRIPFGITYPLQIGT